jgi:AraC family transcriptional regulator, carnitine catabolism transcriptional activator
MTIETNTPAGANRRRPAVLTAHPVTKPETIGLLLAPRFSMLAFTCAVEPLRVANRLAQCELYQWQTISLEGRPVVASNHMSVVADRSIRERVDYARVAVCAGFEPESLYDERVASWLRNLARAGVALGAIDTGSFVLAHAGLLEGYRAATHWESLEGLRSQYPKVAITPDLFVVDRGRFTCAGGTAALDMMLHVVRLSHGHRLAAAVAEQFIYTRVREPREHQRMGTGERQALNVAWLAKIVEMMEANLEEPLPLRDLCAAAGVAPRRCERGFKRQLRMSARRYYLNLRLQRARTFLQYTNLPVLDAAVACGFRNVAHFSRAYKLWAGVPPSADRQRMHQGVRPILS